MSERPRCINCGTDYLVTHLHRERGGPIVCAKCGNGILLEISRQRKTQEAIVAALGFDTLETLAFHSRHSDPGQLSLELLDDVLSLVDPDNHPSERAFLARRVTDELLALRPFAKPKSEGTDGDFPVTVPHRISARTGGEAPQEPRSYPCQDCRHTVPRYYCDDCHGIWERERRTKRERQNASARKRRARKRMLWRASCAQCENVFTPTRRDARFCSAACRQKAHRKGGAGN